MTRLHSPTKSGTLGIGGVLLASVVYGLWHDGRHSTHELLITLFIFLTAPITANFIAKAYLHRERAQAAKLPPTATAYVWARYDPPPTTPADAPEYLARPRRNGDSDRSPLLFIKTGSTTCRERG